jgi:steroid 5-alpha reductase family enzyme
MALALVSVLAAMALVMTCAWLTQRAVKNAGWIDVFWTFGSGACCAAVALWPEGPATARQALVAALAAIWAIRLGAYIAARVAGSAEDTRYTRFRKEWGTQFQTRMLQLALVQAPATTLLASSVFAAAHRDAPMDIRDGLGAAVMLLAVLGESLADEQMRRFKRKAGHGAIMDRGLWSWSRHPNYFFEWLGWLAYPVIGLDFSNALSYLTLVAPALMYLILRFATGVPALEKTMLESRGDAFVRYQQRVSTFLPRPPRSVSP